MLDIKIIRDFPKKIAALLLTRGFHFDVEQFTALDTQRKHLQTSTQALQSARNLHSKNIGIANMQGIDTESMRQEVTVLGEKLEIQKAELEHILQQLNTLLLNLPNLPHPSVPKGKNENDNQIIRAWGKPPSFDFEAKSHFLLGENLGQMDFALAAKITGSRFVVMKAGLAKLHRALIQFMLDIHTLEHGYQEVYVPYIVNTESLLSTGQLPKLAEDIFKLQGEQGYYLAPTAEVPVTNIIRDTILNPSSLPLRYVCHTPCFRSEAGSYGKDTKGLIRQHQFEKVELVWVTEPENSEAALEKLTQHAESILQKLNLAYRVMSLCTGDLGNSSSKTYDLEVWLPSQNTFREISSCSNMHDFQARRLKARFKDPKTHETKLVHTLNGSGLAIGRTLVAIMEQNQDQQGNIRIPTALLPYMGGLKLINPLK